MHGRANWWRVWLNHKPVSPPIRLPDSHGRWSPIATAESWDGGTGGACNTFLYRFRHVSIAHAPGGGWHQLTDGYPIQSAVTRIQRARGSCGLPRRGRPAGLPAPRRYFLIQIGVPSGASACSFLAVVFETRTQPCETAWPSSCGRLVPWMPTTPPPGHSVSFE